MKKIALALGAILISTSVFASDFRFAYDLGEFSTPEKFAAFHLRLENAARNYCVSQHMESANSAEVRLHSHHLHFEESCLTSLVSRVVDRIGDKGLLSNVAGQSSRRG